MHLGKPLASAENSLLILFKSNLQMELADRKAPLLFRENTIADFMQGREITRA